MDTKQTESTLSSWPISLEAELTHKSREDLVVRFFTPAHEMISQLGLEIYDIEYNVSQGRMILYIIDPKTNTAVIEDCVKVDRALSPFIDAATWIPQHFVLEVSSPGLNRNLRILPHFEKAMNKTIALVLTQKIDHLIFPHLPKKYWNNKKLRGNLVGISEQELRIDLDGVEIPVPRTQLKKAYLDPELWSQGQKDKRH